MDRLAFGLIGATHATVIGGLPDARLVAVADTNPARARSLAERHGAMRRMI